MKSTALALLVVTAALAGCVSSGGKTGLGAPDNERAAEINLQIGTDYLRKNNLNQAIVAIRRALGDNAEPRRFVQTISGRGYCFVAAVRASSVTSLRVAEPSRGEQVFTVADYF